jgi:hypothetical protein
MWIFFQIKMEINQSVIELYEELMDNIPKQA